MELRRLFVSLATVVVTFVTLLNLPTGVHTVPLRRYPMEDRPPLPPPYDTHKKNRYTRETSESIVAMATTSQLPEPEEESTEGSGAEVQAVRCNPLLMKQSRCKTLQEKLQEYFERNRFQRPLDAFYNDFVLDDLHYFGLLGGPSNIRQNSQRARDFGDDTCERILQHYHRPRVVSAGRCTWNYTCSYNPNRFPRFRVQASLIDAASVTLRLHCMEERMNPVTYFERMACEGDPCRTENWEERVDPNIVVGYVEQPSG